jgi:naphthalene 1,2-dioxygenase system ferredoxin subunit
MVWVALPVPMPAEGRSVGFRFGERSLLLCNVGGRAYVLDDQCSHARTPLAGGRLCGHVLECPLHGGKIDVRDGSPAAPPIRRAVRSWPVRLVNGAIEIALEGGR